MATCQLLVNVTATPTMPGYIYLSPDLNYVRNKGQYNSKMDIVGALLMMDSGGEHRDGCGGGGRHSVPVVVVSMVVGIVMVVVVIIMMVVVVVVVMIVMVGVMMGCGGW